uniref:Glutaminase n=1 Tax=Amphimedon queenslandica TaxID=400682 RepID=A0A1X7UG98_AMPQE
MVTFAVLCLLACVLSAKFDGPHLVPNFRPPSVPLVVVNPYLSIWSDADHLYDDFPKHWSGPVICLSGMISIDGKVYRFMAKDTDLAPDVMTQVNLTVYPTQTVYVFQESGIQLTLTFSTPAFAATDKIPTLPITFLTYTVEAIDGLSNHTIKIYYDNTAEGVVSDTKQMVIWEHAPLMRGQIAMRMGTTEQDYFGQDSDRINWGYWYVSTILDRGVIATMAPAVDTRTAFIEGKVLPPEDKNKPRACQDNWPVLAIAWDFGTITPGQPSQRWLQISYDQVYSMKYFGTAMEPLWKHNYENFTGLIRNSEYETLKKACDDKDAEIIEALYSVGGQNYATISSLAWRQAIGGTIAVWNNVTNEPWVFLKEISSGGATNTVDVIFPVAPLFLWDLPEALQLMLLPLLNYANNGTKKYGLDIPYNLEWAPHHLGHWPVCDLEPNNEEQMPVEASGDMLLMIAGVVLQTKNLTFLDPYWPLLTIWADFIVASLPDPGNQLCTDDFEGPSPHNMNLAAKGMVALGAYSQLLRMKGDTASAEKYETANTQFIQYWTTNGLDGDHYKRQYNLPGSWSLKYNLLFQKILKLNLFPQSVFDQELKYYMSKMNTYGIPMDDRHLYTKTDWLMWTAAMASDDQFNSITSAVYKFANETPDRSPFTDWYAVDTAHRQGFTARPVIGGLYARLLTAMKN